MTATEVDPYRLTVLQLKLKDYYLLLKATGKGWFMFSLEKPYLYCKRKTDKS